MIILSIDLRRTCLWHGWSITLMLTRAFTSDSSVKLYFSSLSFREVWSKHFYNNSIKEIWAKWRDTYCSYSSYSTWTGIELNDVYSIWPPSLPTYHYYLQFVSYPYTPAHSLSPIINSIMETETIWNGHIYIYGWLSRIYAYTGRNVWVLCGWMQLGTFSGL